MEELFRRYVSVSASLWRDGRIKVDAGLCDTFHEAHLELEVDRTSKCIVAITGEFTRAPHYEHCVRTTAGLERLIGLNAWLGSGRSIREAVSGSDGCTHWEELVLAAVQACIQADNQLQGREKPWPEARAELTKRYSRVCNAYSHWEDVGFEHWERVGERPHTQEVFRRYLSSCVRLAGPATLWVEGSLSDSGHEVRLDMDVQLPDCTITRVKGDFVRPPQGEICSTTTSKLQGLVGHVAWPGGTRAIREAVAGGTGCIRWQEVVIEAYRAVMQAHYPLVQRQHADNPRLGRQMILGLLKNSCYAYSKLRDDPEWNSERTAVVGSTNM